MIDEPVCFRVNGRDVRVQASGQIPLLYVLRNDLQLKATRFGCGTGACGSCTVMVGSRAVQSCDTPLWSVQGQDVTTVEGLGSPQQPGAVQQAFLELQAAQCGYCIDGIMMSVAALRAGAQPPTEQALQDALSRHLCRCGAHMRILAAARHALGLPAPS
jgi:nicotinate dehydrogenase subunit A